MSVWCVVVSGLISTSIANAIYHLNQTEVKYSNGMVPITLVEGAASKGAVCIDGSPPAYHLDRGSGSGANNWVVFLEGGGWCNDAQSCTYRKNSALGSSNRMEKQIDFGGILSNQAERNPDYFNWNRVKVRYCDGSSFTGDSEDKALGLQFRGQRVYSAVMEELLSKGMSNAQQALLSGCSAGGLATILHCDQFKSLFPSSVKVKCVADAGFFLDAIDIAGGHNLRNYYNGVVSLHGVKSNLPSTCTNHLDATSCFFPENVIDDIKTPLFLLNAAYDTWQVQYGLAPNSTDPQEAWNNCKRNILKCSDSQIQILQDFRNHMLNAIKGFSTSQQSGFFINSCFTHCQSEREDTWVGYNNPPLIDNKGITESVGDWYFDRAASKAIDCPYPCDKTCHNDAS